MIFMSVNKENEGVTIHATQQGDSISVQASTIQGSEIEFPKLRTVHGCRSLNPPRTDHASKHMTLFYTPKQDTSEVVSL